MLLDCLTQLDADIRDSACSPLSISPLIFATSLIPFTRVVKLKKPMSKAGIDIEHFSLPPVCIHNSTEKPVGIQSALDVLSCLLLMMEETREQLAKKWQMKSFCTPARILDKLAP